jgi:hypothetical protein
MDRRPPLARLVRWLGYLGVSDADPDETRAQKVALTLAASSVIGLAVIWVATYAALGIYLPPQSRLRTRSCRSPAWSS